MGRPVAVCGLVHPGRGQPPGHGQRFWAASIAAGRAGAPTRLPGGFDPAVTPAQLVEASPVVGDDELLARWRPPPRPWPALDGIDADGGRLPAEAPPGHLAIAGWPSTPCGTPGSTTGHLPAPRPSAAEEPDEVAAASATSAGLGPAILATAGSTRTGAFGVE